MIPDERAYPFSWNGNCSYGFTKRELLGAKMAQGILQGLYSFQGNIGLLTEADIAKAAWKMADMLVKKA